GKINVSAGNGSSARSANAINDGIWHHVAFTRDVTSGAVQTFVDGVLSGTGTTESGYKSTGFKRIGCVTYANQDGTYPGTATYLNGSLDDVRFFNYILTLDEVVVLKGQGGSLGVRIVKWQETQ